MVKCENCGAEVVRFVGNMITEDPLLGHAVEVDVCDCWAIFWDATKGIGFDAKIHDKRKGSGGHKFVEAEKVSSLGSFR